MNKKLALIFALLLSANITFAYEYPSYVQDGIKNEDTVCYSSSVQKWSRTQEKDNVCFTKYTTSGTGGYSEFEMNQKVYETGKEGTTYEFLHNGDLIGYNAHQLRFYKLNFDGEKINADTLTETQVRELFPDIEVVKISQFKNNKITLFKPWFRQKSFMLLNDTNTDFYKYQFEKMSGYELIRGMFETCKYQVLPEVFVFSHFGSKSKMTPPLKITVKNKNGN